MTLARSAPRASEQEPGFLVGPTGFVTARTGNKHAIYTYDTLCTCMYLYTRICFELNGYIATWTPTVRKMHVGLP